MFPLNDESYARLCELGPFAFPEYPFYPLQAPGMPPVGPNMLALAIAQGDGSVPGKGKQPAVYGPLLQLLHFRALYDPQFTLPVAVGQQRVAARMVLGHPLGRPPTGPRRADVMIIGKSPGREEEIAGRQFVGPTAQHFWNACRDVGIPPEATADWYITNLVRYAQPDPNAASLKSDWINDSLPMLAQELRIVRPRLIVCLGADASKAVSRLVCPNAGRTGFSVEVMRGRVEQAVFPIHVRAEDPPRYHCAQFITMVHPARVHREPEYADTLRDGVKLLWQLAQGGVVSDVELDVDHRVISDETTLTTLVDEILASPDPNDRIMAVDAEWNGDRPWDPGAYLRTVQFSHKPKFAACVALRAPGGAEMFQPNIDAAVKQLRRLFLAPGMRVGGHFFRSDIPWIHRHLNIDLRPNYAAPATAADVTTAGGWDTSLLENAVCETGLLGLEVLRAKYTTAPAYEGLLTTWRRKFCAERGIDASEMEGFGEWDGPEFYRYACLHGSSLVQLADGTWRRIRELVRTKYSGKVKSLVGGRVVDATVTNWHRQDVGQKDWFKLVTPSAQYGRHGLLGPALTPDHKVLTQRGKIRVDALRPGADSIATAELEFSPAQLSVFLGCLLGDGGFTRQNKHGVGFGFGQRTATAAYADWKASVFATHTPKLRERLGQRRYETAFARYFTHLAQRFPTKPRAEHRHRKAAITPELLSHLGMLGLAVWYQDDGTYVPQREGTRAATSRIYCKITDAEAACVLDWLRTRFGTGVTYNHKNRFIQFAGVALGAFHDGIRRYMHPAMAYKTPFLVKAAPRVAPGTKLFYEPITSVVRAVMPTISRGHGVRYCLTVADAGNFLTQAGFVSNCYDADVTRRLAGRLFELIKSDRLGHDCRESYWVTHRASLAVLEMEQVGMIPDVERVESLARIYSMVRSALTNEIRAQVNWPAFNPQADGQCRGVLFGARFARKPAPAGVATTWVDPNDEKAASAKAVSAAKKAHKAAGAPVLDGPQWVYAIPEQCRTLDLTPITSTGKRPQEWARIVARGEEDNNRPSTGREVLGILAHAHPVVRMLRDIRFLSKALQTVLRQPELDPETGQPQLDEDGEKVFEKGLLSHVSTDGRIHTRILQTMETGRASSSKPNLQNQSSRREDDYRMILGYDDPKKGPMGRYRHLFEGRALYPYPQRTIFKAPPGRIFIEADYTGAELAGIMWLANDPQGIEDVRRNMLAEDHPEYFDIHSNSAVRAFGLNCVPTKSALIEMGKPGLRVAAKNVNFGIPYGRGAVAIARQCREEGVDATPETAQQLIDYYFERYARVAAFLNACKARTTEPGWIRGVMGRYRRFHHVEDRGVQMEQERQACNFPIQNMVAEAAWTALGNMWEYREANRWLDFNFVLQIHDAIKVDAALEHAPLVYREVLPRCMVDMVNIWPTDLSGVRRPVDAPYHLGVGREVMFRWGEDVDTLAKARFGEKLTPLMDDPANDGIVVDRLRQLAM